MWPREHGTYGELGFPLLTALVVGEPGAAALALVAAALAAYLAHEPLLVLRGVRGERRLREQRSRAWRWLLGFGCLALSAGGCAYLWADATTRLWMLLPLLLALAALGFVWRGSERTLVGELTAGSALVSASVPVGLAAGLSLSVALWTALLWLTSFSLMTFAVRGVARVRFDAGASLRLAGRVLSAAVLASLALLGLQLLPAWALFVLLPTWLAGTVLVARPPPPRHMRRVGWSLIATSVLTFAIFLQVTP